MQPLVWRVDAEWVKSPTGRRVLALWADPRPAWLWSADGRALLWRNDAAPAFSARIRKGSLKLGPEPLPIRGQVSRLVRLGSLGRSSLSRLRFLAGDKPVSATCTATPLALPGGDTGLLVVGVDPIGPEVLAATAAFPGRPPALPYPPGAEYLLVEAGKVRGGTPHARERFTGTIERQGVPVLPDTATAQVNFDGATVRLTRLASGPRDIVLLLVEGMEPAAPGPGIATIRAEEGLPAFQRHAQAGDAAATAPAETADRSEAAAPAGRSLSSLFDRLAGHRELYAPLPDPGVEPALQVVTEVEPEPQGAGGEKPAQPEPDTIAAIIEFAEDDADAPAPRPAAPAGVAWRVTGRGFAPLAGAGEKVPRTPATAPAAPALPADAAAPDGDRPPPAEAVERVSRYNFDELSRILIDRVGAEPAAAGAAGGTEPAGPPGRDPDRALVNVAAETFILNRLPLGIMVFRDQQVLFANRALTDLIGYETVDALRAAGLAAVFPTGDAAVAGPVTHLVHSSGVPLPVVARLQSITWQGRPALMLSAGLGDGGAGREGMVKAFAEALAARRGEGFVVTSRAGIVERVTPEFAAIIGGASPDIVGKPLAALIAAKEARALRAFLEEPARFAETARPSLEVGSVAPHASLLLFTEGSAGLVSGYFGFLRRSGPTQALSGGQAPVEASMLTRVSRAVRRPLNTIIGFADMIRSAAFGTIENQRYLEYARDIRTAGQEIAALVDELDDIARLREGSYATQPAELDLVGLLETCTARVREQAGAARVLVRSAISQRLPRIRADGASLRQAVLNLLASAIDQTPPGGTVVLSAQFEDDGSIAVNVRDSGGHSADPAERFVVFRDGVGKDGEVLVPMRSSVGLALTRSLLAVNTCSLSVDPAGAVGTLFSLIIPAELVAR